MVFHTTELKYTKVFLENCDKTAL